MAKKSSFMKKTLKRVKRETQPILESALRTGVERISSELRVVGYASANQPSASALEKVAEVLKSGLFAAGQELMDKGVQRLRTIGSKDF